ncbi:phosphoenolpyruvate carboxykinase [Candidatus Woesearchaeota archaeon B3_Woes]|nr:MAG: phosphoenolpyruvate carboxykinase [Candidatus Woesearchaeota archaeon B3_Woes]
MEPNKTNFSFYNKQVIIKSNGEICKNSRDLTKTELFKNIIHRFLEDLRERDSPFLNVFPEKMSKSEQEKTMINLLQKLSESPKEKIIKTAPEFTDFFKDNYLLHQFVEELYDYWRNFERFFVCYSTDNNEEYTHKKPYRTFNKTIGTLNHLVRKVYRDICENITNDHPRVYRQISAGCQVGLIVAKEDWKCPSYLDNQLRNINFIKQVLIEPPLIIDSPMNKRTGQFKKVDTNPLKNIELKSEDWLCYPAKVGELVIHLFFHNNFIGLGTAVANLFELVDDKDLEKKPDAIFAYGVPKNSLDKFGKLPTVFFDDEKNNIFVAAIQRSDDFGYFGYIKKMMLTLHNIIMMKKGRLPIHGAMVNIALKNGKSSNIVILGDTGTGKSESLEAFRVLGKKYIRDMTIIFDDMGSLELKNNKIKAYGTETGAFVRLDDLQPGFAFGNIDRSIIISPQKTNARALLPVTTLKEVLHGYPIDFLLYANNYEEVDKEHPLFDEFESVDDALEVFNEGARMAKGTTTEKGIVHTYFANVFGPVQYRDIHEKLALKYFKVLFKSGVRIAQLRTRLGIPGFETKGPESAAEELFEIISKTKKGSKK